MKRRVSLAVATVTAAVVALVGGVAWAAAHYDNGSARAGVPSASSSSSTAAGSADNGAPSPDDEDRAHENAGPRDYNALWRAATPAERAGAVKLVSQTRAATAKFKDINVALAAGYRPNPMGGPNATHYPNQRLITKDNKVLDPKKPEALMYWTAPDGKKILIAAVYKSRPNQKAPAPGGDLTAWHTHIDDKHLCHPAQDKNCPKDKLKMIHVFFFKGVRDPFSENMYAAAGGRGLFIRAMRAMEATN